jgi:polysaccharide biosynthesis protein PslE
MQLANGGVTLLPTSHRPMSTARRVLDIFFRRKVYLAGFSAVLVAALAAYLLVSEAVYPAQMLLMIKNSRAEMVVSPDSAATSSLSSVNDAQLATEIQLLSSNDVMRHVVQATGLVAPASGDSRLSGAERIESATTRLQRAVRVAPVLKANMIRVRYENADREKATAVLRALADEYMKRHVQVHRSAGTYAFFDEQARLHQDELRSAQVSLGEFRRTHNVVLLEQQKDLLLRKLVDLDAAFKENEANRADTENRIRTLRSQSSGATARINTQSRVLPNQYSVERLNTLVIELQNKRTELLAKFHADDRLVQQVEQQIRDTRKALEEVAKTSAVEQVTDVNPVRQALESELVRSEYTLTGLKARSNILAQQLGVYRSQLAELERATVEHDDRSREVKALEGNLSLYTRRREEARIEDALDQQKITNVVLVEPPTVSVAPTSKLSGTVLAAFLLAEVILITSILITGLRKATAYTPFELEMATGIPVLATVPYSLTGKGAIDVEKIDIRHAPEVLS